MKAMWNNAVIAESEDTVVIEGNHYFPLDAIRQEFLVASQHQTTCSWKGVASYYSLSVDGKVNENAAWYYPSPKPEAAAIEQRVAFWKGVQVQP